MIYKVVAMVSTICLAMSLMSFGWLYDEMLKVKNTLVYDLDQCHINFNDLMTEYEALTLDAQSFGYDYED